MKFDFFKRLNLELDSNFSMSFLSEKYTSYKSVKLIAVLLFLMLFPFGIQISFAKDINIPMDLTNWQFKGTPFECQLIHKVAPYGDLYFHGLPSNRLQLVLSQANRYGDWQTGVLSQLSAPWIKPHRAMEVDKGEYQQPAKLVFNHNIAQLLSAMSSGAWLKVTSNQKAQLHSQSVVVPATNMTASLAKFNQCRASLPDMSIAEARDLVLRFEFGQRVVTAKQRKQLKALASYIKVDQQVEKVLIDGHTDNVGTSISNLQISKVRADDVASVLLELGTPMSLVEVRAHGARYPVSDNNSEYGKAKNRRVTIRVIRNTTLASNKGSSRIEDTKVQ